LSEGQPLKVEKAPHADGRADRDLALPRQQRERRGVRAQPGCERGARVGGERCALPARFARIAVDDLDQRS
jgi:hypothetical protein